jgi:ribosome-binding protein aMBF1 (putative translation factor)
MSRLNDRIDQVAIDEHLGEKAGEGTKRYKAARTKALRARRAKAVHSELTDEIDAHVERKQATLAQVRQAVGLTQTQLAEELGIAQGDVSKIERRDNLRLTTLARFIEATGGHLRIVAIYDDTEVDLAIGDITADA